MEGAVPDIEAYEVWLERVVAERLELQPPEEVMAELYVLRDRLERQRAGLVFGCSLPDSKAFWERLSRGPVAPLVKRTLEALEQTIREHFEGVVGRRVEKRSATPQVLEAVLPALLPLQSSPDPDLRWCVAFELSRGVERLQRERTVRALASQLEVESDDEVVDQLVRALARHGERGPLVALSRSPVVRRRWSAALGLECAREDWAVELLTSLISDSDESVQCRALRSLRGRPIEAFEAQLLESMRLAERESPVRGEIMPLLGEAGVTAALGRVVAIALDDTDPAQEAALLAISGYASWMNSHHSQVSDDEIELVLVFDGRAPGSSVEVLSANHHARLARARALGAPVYLPKGRGMACLSELDAVDWSVLPHAYLLQPPHGDALICGLVDPHREEGDAYADVISHLWHQGSIYVATIHAVPFLCALCFLEQPGASRYALSALALIAASTLHSDDDDWDEDDWDEDELEEHEGDDLEDDDLSETADVERPKVGFEDDPIAARVRDALVGVDVWLEELGRNGGLIGKTARHIHAALVEPIETSPQILEALASALEAEAHEPGTDSL